MLSDFKQQSIFRINENTERIGVCLGRLSEELIWKPPNQEITSIGNLILHLEGNITQYIHSSLGEEKDNRNRNEEFTENQNLTKAELLSRIKKCTQKATEIINTVSEPELNRKRLVQGFELSGTGIIIHVVEHYSYHVGQIALLTKLFTNQDLGFYKNLDLTITNNI
ncbi:MAG: DUF1572 family protein [Flavobacteriales bacterium]|nr:DUF1572 family protein [Flavobacteriales bacterium]